MNQKETNAAAVAMWVRSTPSEENVTRALMRLPEQTVARILTAVSDEITELRSRLSTEPG
jgi:hypothetical protein